MGSKLNLYFLLFTILFILVPTLPPKENSFVLVEGADLVTKIFFLMDSKRLVIVGEVWYLCFFFLADRQERGLVIF